MSTVECQPASWRVADRRSWPHAMCPIEQASYEEIMKHPNRPPDWRNRVARDRRPDSVVTSTKDPLVILMARKYAYDAKNDFGAKWPVVPNHDSLHCDILAAQTVRYWNPAKRARFEAYILAGRSDAEIAKLTGKSVGVARAYEAVHFNVRDRLDDKDYILRCAFFGRPEGSSLYAIDDVIRLVAYHKSESLLDSIIRGAYANWKDLEREEKLRFDRSKFFYMQLSLNRELAPMLVDVRRQIDAGRVIELTPSLAAAFEGVYANDEVPGYRLWREFRGAIRELNPDAEWCKSKTADPNSGRRPIRRIRPAPY